MTEIKKSLRRPREGVWIAGVCAGLAQYFDLDPVVVRAAYVIVSVISAAFPGILLYLLLWLVIPREPEPAVSV